MRCPSCNTNVVTRVENHSGWLAAISSILCCSVGLVCGYLYMIGKLLFDSILHG